jgi:hypothetical protein
MSGAIHNLRVAVNFHTAKEGMLNSNMSIAFDRE